MPHIRMHAWQLCLLASTFIVAVNNSALFSSLFETLPLLSLQGAAYLALIVILMIGTLFAAFLVAGVGQVLKPLIAVTVIVSAIVGYFTNAIGVVFDIDMMRNVADTVTEGNVNEALELVSGPMLLHTLFFGGLPAALLVPVTLVPTPILAELRSRARYLAATAALIAAVALPNYKYLVYYSVEHRDLRFEVTPIFAFLSLAKFIDRRSAAETAPFHSVGTDAERHKSVARRIVGVMVVGETARADHFSLNGYSRETNPLLENEPGLVFIDAEACGTSTAFSVPCVFSMRGRGDYSPALAKRESNVLDVLQYTGVKTVWIDNNSSCKGVCNRIETTNLRLEVDPLSQYYSDGGYYDEVLIEQLERHLDATSSDLLIVLHTLGSHGPAYSHRYPPAFAEFTPYCARMSPTECSDREVENAYDNTIVYTDYILSLIIDQLKQRDDEFESFMLYVSDHGESLGEKGVYLHGLPYSLAPRAQTRVPLILWLSPTFAIDRGMDSDAPVLRNLSGISHDNVSHSLLGLFDVTTRAYHAESDIVPHKSILASSH